MTGSQGGPASGGAVALGIALLFGSGAWGFYLLTETARPGVAPVRPVFQPARPHDDTPPNVPTAPVADGDSNPAEAAERSDFFPLPTLTTGSLPVR